MVILINKKSGLISVNGKLEKESFFYGEGIVVFPEKTKISKDDVIDHSGDIQRIFKGRYLVFCRSNTNARIFIVNDWLSKMPVFYFDSRDFFIASNSFFEVVNACLDLKCTLSPSIEGLYLLLEKSGLCGELTQFKEIKYLRRFCRIELDEFFSLKIIALKPAPHNVGNKKETVKKLDFLFGKALDSFSAYNSHLGFPNYFTISGGMDSRMVFLTSLKRKIKPFSCVSYSMKGCVDHLVSTQICEDSKTPLYFLDITNGSFIKAFGKSLSMNGGQQIYCGSTGAIVVNEKQKEWMKDCSGAPLLYCGLLGGELLAFEKCDLKLQYKKIEGFKVFDQVVDHLNKMVRNPREDFLENNTRLCQNLCFQLSDCGVCLSPFMDEDFYEFALSIPPKFLKRRGIYKLWMRKSVDNNYVTTYDKSRIGDSAIKVFINRAKDKIRRKINGSTIFDMISFKQWLSYEENASYINSLFTSLFENIKDTLPMDKDTFYRLYLESDEKRKLSLLTYMGVLNYERMYIAD